MPIGKLKACSFCCFKRRSAVVLARRCLLVVLVICALAVAFLSRWVFSNHSAIFWKCIAGRQQNNAAQYHDTSKEFLERYCAVKAKSECLTDKLPQTIAVNTGLQRPYNLQLAGLSPRICPASAVAQLAENVYSNEELPPVRRLPQCLIIGVKKGGTRALLEFFNLHPDVQAPWQEQRFFNNDTRYKRGIEWYRRQMPPTHGG